MLYYVFSTALGDTVLGSLNTGSVLKFLLSFNENNCITQSINKILNNKDSKEWHEISRFSLPEAFIRKFRNNIDWIWISMYQKLSEEFIREFRDRVYWYWISFYQNLSEEFIHEFRDRVHWYWISRYQNLSENFIREFRNRIDWYFIHFYKTLTKDFVHKLRNRLKWYSMDGRR